MEKEIENQGLPEDYENPKIEGEIDTVAEELEYLEKKKKNTSYHMDSSNSYSFNSSTHSYNESESHADLLNFIKR